MLLGWITAELFAKRMTERLPFLARSDGGLNEALTPEITLDRSASALRHRRRDDDALPPICFPIARGTDSAHILVIRLREIVVLHPPAAVGIIMT